MRTIALRFGEHFSPKCGTIAAHEEIINDIGYVWYGKMGLWFLKISLMRLCLIVNREFY